MKKLAKIMTLLLMVNMCLSYYVISENNAVIATETVGITVNSLIPTKDSVDGFFVWLNDMDIDRALLNDEKNCYCLKDISENSFTPTLDELNIWIYKDSKTGATHLTFDDEVARFIGNDGGFGVTSAALGDLNNDGSYEIYFTYSWNPDTYCSQVGYFDTKTKNVHYFGDYMCPESELIFTAENDILTVCKAELTNYEDKVHYELETSESIAEIVCKDSEIEIKPLSDDFVKLEEKLEPTEKTLPDWLPKSVGEAETFMNENGETFIKDGYICYIKYISGADSYRGSRICSSENSDVKAPVSYKKYRDNYNGDYIVACFEMLPNSFIEICDAGYKNKTLYLYISDENGDVNEGFKGDVNKDKNLNISDLVVLQKWLLGNDDSLGCWQLADICNDNRIDVFDMILLRKLLVEKKQLFSE